MIVYFLIPVIKCAKQMSYFRDNRQAATITDLHTHQLVFISQNEGTCALITLLFFHSLLCDSFGMCKTSPSITCFALDVIPLEFFFVASFFQPACALSEFQMIRIYSVAYNCFTLKH